MLARSSRRRCACVCLSRTPTCGSFLNTPLRQVISCPNPLPTDSVCTLSVRMPTDHKGEGRAMLRIIVPGVGKTDLPIALCRRADLLAISWEAVYLARPVRPEQGLLWIRNYTDADRHLPGRAPAPRALRPRAPLAWRGEWHREDPHLSSRHRIYRGQDPCGRLRSPTALDHGLNPLLIADPTLGSTRQMLDMDTIAFTQATTSA